MGGDGRPGAGSPAPVPPRRRRGWILALGAGLVVAALAGGAGILGSRSLGGDPEPENAPRGTPLAQDAGGDGPTAQPRTAVAGELDELRRALVRARDATAELTGRLDAAEARTAELASLRRELGELRQQMAGARAPARTSPAPVPDPDSAAGTGASSAELLARLYAVEQALQREGGARIELQERIDGRLFNLEAQRDRSDADRLEAQESLSERLFNLEQRLQGLEERSRGFEARVLERLDRLERAR